MAHKECRKLTDRVGKVEPLAPSIRDFVKIFSVFHYFWSTKVLRIVVQPISIGFHEFWACFTWSIECKTDERMRWTKLWLRLSRTPGKLLTWFQKDSICIDLKFRRKIHFFEIRTKKISILNSLRWDAFLTQSRSCLPAQKDQNSKSSKTEFFS